MGALKLYCSGAGFLGGCHQGLHASTTTVSALNWTLDSAAFFAPATASYATAKVRLAKQFLRQIGR